MKRFKKILTSAAALLLAVCFTFGLAEKADAASTAHFADYAGVVSKYEARQLDDYFTQLSSDLGFDVAGVVVDGHNYPDIASFADDYYDYYGFGTGAGHDGVIFVIDMKERLPYISTCGYGTVAFTDYGINQLQDQMHGYLVNSQFFDAYKLFGSTAEYYVEQARQGHPVDQPVDPTDPEKGMDAGTKGLLSAAIGALTGLLSSGRKKAQLKSVHGRRDAGNYLRPGSMELTARRDVFLYSNVAVTPRPQPSSSQGPRPGGGSTVHISSSGRTHGGGAGPRF